MKTLRNFILLAATAMLVVSAPIAFAGDKGCSKTCSQQCGSYSAALKQASAAGKPLVLDFYTEW